MLNKVINTRFEVITKEIIEIQGQLGSLKYSENPELCKRLAARYELLDKARMALRECKCKTEAGTLRKLNQIVREFFWTYSTPSKRDGLNQKDADLMEYLTQECLNIIDCAA